MKFSSWSHRLTGQLDTKQGWSVACEIWAEIASVYKGLKLSELGAPGWLSW